MSAQRGRGGLWVAGAVLAVLAAVAGAWTALDSPAERRRQRLDERRVNDLRHLRVAIDAFWAKEHQLPPDLESLAGWQEWADVPKDPETGADYRYRTTGTTTFEICASFATTSRDDESRPLKSSTRASWRHDAGEQCFAQEVDEDG